MANIKYCNGFFVTADNRIATSSNKNKLDNKFLYWWMESNLISIQSTYRGASIKHPSMNDVLSLKISFPSIKEQRIISNYLDQVDTLITLHQRKCKIWIIFSKTDRILIRGSKMDYKSLVKEYREQQLLTQAELAKKLNVGIADISRWENGKYEPTMKIKRVLKSLFIESGLIKGETNNE